jgi:hypothetical protein
MTVLHKRRSACYVEVGGANSVETGGKRGGRGKRKELIAWKQGERGVEGERGQTWVYMYVGELTNQCDVAARHTPCFGKLQWNSECTCMHLSVCVYTYIHS